MSKLKSKNILLVLILALISFFAFGCKNETPVRNIYFSVSENQEQIILLAGQTLDMQDFVVVEPSYAANKNYTLHSSDESVLKVQNKSIVALKKGFAYIKVVSNDNPKSQDAILISVEDQMSTLPSPTNLRYDKLTQSFSFHSVNGAAGYTLNVNDKEIEIGNSTSFALKDLSETLDKVLDVKVKANSSKYSFAVEDSNYGEVISIYQASGVKNVKIVGGELVFNRLNSDNTITIKMNNSVLLANTQVESYNLKNLNGDLAGTNATIELFASAKTEVVDSLPDGVDYNDSTISTINFEIIDAPKLTMNGEVVSWGNLPGVSNYKVLIDGEEVANVSDNHIDLSEPSLLNEYVARAEDYTLKVVAELDENCTNLASTIKESEIVFNRLQTPTASVVSNKVEWQAVECADLYSVNISGGSVNETITNN
mgnify:CR=1 FL=1